MLINEHRYTFQGQEHDDEIKGEGNSLNYKYRMHDPRLGRFFAVDPLTLSYPFYTPYSFSGNKVIAHREIEGLEDMFYMVSFNGQSGLSEVKFDHKQDGLLCNCTGEHLNLMYEGQKLYIGSEAFLNEGWIKSTVESLQELTKEEFDKKFNEFKVEYDADEELADQRLDEMTTDLFIDAIAIGGFGARAIGKSNTPKPLLKKSTSTKLNKVTTTQKKVTVSNSNANVPKTSSNVVKGPKPNGGNAKPHGNPNHDGRIDNFTSRIKKNPGVSNIRKNQQQVNVNGEKVGTNKPDVQFDYEGKHYNVEWDHSAKSSQNHRITVTKNDPNAVNKFYRLKK